MIHTLEDIAQTIGKAREFVECNLRLGAMEGSNIMSLPPKRALVTWQSFYHTTINGPGQIVQWLLLLVW